MTLGCPLGRRVRRILGRHAPGLGSGLEGQCYGASKPCLPDSVGLRCVRNPREGLIEGAGKNLDDKHFCILATGKKQDVEGNSTQNVVAWPSGSGFT